MSYLALSKPINAIPSERTVEQTDQTWDRLALMTGITDPSAEAARLEGISLMFRNRGREGTLVLDDVDFSIAKGEFLAVVGPSGCGKTTILHMLAGLLKPTLGKVSIDGREVDGPSKKIGYMLARAGLSPWRTARRNVELGLEIQRVARAQRRETATRLLQQVGLERYADHYPSQLSQGMRQRVAIARTLALEPEIILMDEPFAALDAQTRLSVQAQFMTLWERSRPTVVFVTHDLEEAILLADRVLVMTHGPSTVKAQMDVRFARPRHIANLRFDSEFLKAQHDLWAALREEIEDAPK